MTNDRKPTGLERIRIAAHAIVSERTVLRVYQGRASEHSVERVRRAAMELGLPVPPAIPKRAA